MFHGRSDPLSELAGYDHRTSDFSVSRRPERAESSFRLFPRGLLLAASPPAEGVQKPLPPFPDCAFRWSHRGSSREARHNEFIEISETARLSVRLQPGADFNCDIFPGVFCRAPTLVPWPFLWLEQAYWSVSDGRKWTTKVVYSRIRFCKRPKVINKIKWLVRRRPVILIVKKVFNISYVILCQIWIM